MKLQKALDIINQEIINEGIPRPRLNDLSVLIAFKTLQDSGLKFELADNKLGVKND